ncbi:hypothetical protein HAZT_HAZT004300 [Hyalella azteca]|uniref:Uncharacterized protein n=1 Tax=Hyalella azteca TaxID=294128 RepID=A0A6A0H205_HYAAZ|nr:hypothetical protein HAZT_HAZT004300 [Hyalella azteca]
MLTWWILFLLTTKPRCSAWRTLSPDLHHPVLPNTGDTGDFTENLEIVESGNPRASDMIQFQEIGQQENLESRGATEEHDDFERFSAPNPSSLATAVDNGILLITPEKLLLEAQSWDRENDTAGDSTIGLASLEDDDSEKMLSFEIENPDLVDDDENDSVDVVTKFLRMIESQSMNTNCSKGTQAKLGEGVVDRYAQERFRLEAEVTVNRANLYTRLWKYSRDQVLASKYLLQAEVLTLTEFDEDIFAAGNCYDLYEYPGYELYCPFAHRLPDGHILVKDLAVQYFYLANGSDFFLDAKRSAERVIENYSQITKVPTALLSVVILCTLAIATVCSEFISGFMLAIVGFVNCSVATSPTKPEHIPALAPQFRLRPHIRAGRPSALRYIRSSLKCRVRQATRILAPLLLAAR